MGARKGHSKGAKPGKGNATGGAGQQKQKSVTLSSRFTPEQMAEVEKACKARGWSLAQLILQATVEKAVAINELADKSVHVRSIANEIATALRGAMPRMTFKGRDIEFPEGHFDGEWEDFSDRPTTIDFGLRLDGQGDWQDPGYVAYYDRGSRELEIDYYEGLGENTVHPTLLKFKQRSASAETVQQIVDCLAAVGSEMSALLFEAYRGPEPTEGKFRTASDLLNQGD